MMKKKKMMMREIRVCLKKNMTYQKMFFYTLKNVIRHGQKHKWCNGLNLSQRANSLRS